MEALSLKYLRGVGFAASGAFMLFGVYPSVYFIYRAYLIYDEHRCLDFVINNRHLIFCVSTCKR